MSIASSPGATATDYAGLANAISGAQNSGKVSGHHHHGGGSDKFLQAIKDALNQSGVTSGQVPTANTSTQSSSAKLGSDGDNDANRSQAISAQSSVRQDVHKLVEDLFAAIHQAESQTSALAGANTQSSTTQVAPTLSGVSKFDSALQNLIQNVSVASSSSNSTTAATIDSNSGAISKLQTDFVNLVNATSQSNSGNTSSSSGNQPGLQTFLQDLLNNLSRGVSMSAGSLTG